MELQNKLRRVVGNLGVRGAWVEAAYRVSKARQLAEMAYYFVKLRTRDAEYYDYRLFDPAIPACDKAAFLSGGRWAVLHPLLNPPGSRVTVTNKRLFRTIMLGLDVPVPEQLAIAQVGLARRDERGARASLEAALAKVPPDGAVIKPEAGGQVGRGVLVFTAKTLDGVLIHVDGSTYEVERLWSVLRAGIPRGGGGVRPPGNYLVQRRLKTHEQLVGLCPDTLCTARIVTLCHGGHVHVLGASFKIAVGRRGVDNYHGGSIAAPIDLETGVLGAGVREFDDARYEAHPESGVQFAGTQLPWWPEALAFVRRAAPELPRVVSLGWDVALTDEGPVILEANPDWSEDLIQRPQGRGIWRSPLKDAAEHARRRRRRA